MNKRASFFFSSIKFVVLVSCLGFFLHCGGGGAPTTSKGARYASEVTPEIQEKFDEVDRQYRRRQYDYAYAGYDFIINNFPHTKLTDEALYKQGKIFFLTSRFAESRERFLKLSKESPSKVYQAKGHHMAGYASFRQNNFEQALVDFKFLNASDLPAPLRVQALSLIIESVKRLGRDDEFLGDKALLQLYDVYEDYADRGLKNLKGSYIFSYAATLQKLRTWAGESIAINQLPRWLKSYPQSPSTPYVLFKLGTAYYSSSSPKNARRYFSRLVTKYPKSNLVPPAQKMLTELGGPVETSVASNQSFKVGVLLPLVGRYETYGKAVLDGIRCATGDGSVCGEETGIELIVRDPGFTPDSTQQAINELASLGVVAIIGPVSAELSAEAGIAASEKQIPIFPITQKRKLMEQGSYIFQVGMQPEQQIEALVKEAYSRGARTFAIFAPNNNYGEVMSQIFAEQVKSRGGRITAKAIFNRTSVDTFAEVRKLKNSIGRISSPGKGIGFDALFVPDSYQVINTLLPGFEFNGVKDVMLLGTSAWNDPGLSLAISTKFPKSFFVDLYDPSSDGAKVQDFRERFSGSFGRSPRVLEAYGYDAMMMIRTLVSERGKKGIKSGLDNQRSFSGVTGIRGFEEGVGALVDSKVINIKKDGLSD